MLSGIKLVYDEGELSVYYTDDTYPNDEFTLWNKYNMTDVIRGGDDDG